RFAVKPAILVVTLVLLTACAAAPEQMEELEQARAQVQMLSQDPMASEAASRELSAARSSLQAAEDAFEQGDREAAAHFAYLASTQAQTGMARISEQQSRQQLAQAEAERNRVLLEARSREAEQARLAAEQQAQAAQAAKADRAEIQKKLEELKARPTERGMVLTLSDLLFDTSAAVLKPGAELTIDRIAEVMAQNPETRVIIEGHTDSRGSAEYNEELSLRRAEAVARALEARGIDPARIDAVGRGENYPVASNQSAAGQQRNRRVEVIFSDPSGRFAQGEPTG